MPAGRNKNKALLVLENGEFFEGIPFSFFATKLVLATKGAKNLGKAARSLTLKRKCGDAPKFWSKI